MTYATIDQLKGEVGIDSGDTSQDSYLTNLLSWMSGWINTYTGQSFSASPVAVTGEVHDFNVGNKVWLANTNVKSITQLRAGQTSPTTVDPSNYQWNSLGRIIIYQLDGIWPDWSQRGGQLQESDYFRDYISVDYTYGGDGVPDDIAGSCVEMAAEVYRNNGVLREEYEDYKIMYQKIDGAMFSNWLPILDAYRTIHI